MEPVKRYWTVEEYLAHEEATGIKHEYIDGEIYAMSGGTDRHSILIVNLTGILWSQLRGSGCRSHSSDMRVKINEHRYFYPDFSVVCGDANFSDDAHTMLTNPTLVAEVMSPSSKNYDRGLKSEFYFNLESLQAYLLIDQEDVYAQLYTRHEEGWLLREYRGLEAAIPLEAIGCTLPLSDVYEGAT